MNNLVLDQIFEEIAARVALKLKSTLPTQQNARGARLLTIGETASYIGRSKRAVEHLIADGELHPVRQGRRVFLDATDLDRWIDLSKS